LSCLLTAWQQYNEVIYYKSSDSVMWQRRQRDRNRDRNPTNNSPVVQLAEEDNQPTNQQPETINPRIWPQPAHIGFVFWRQIACTQPTDGLSVTSCGPVSDSPVSLFRTPTRRRRARAVNPFLASTDTRITCREQK